MGIAFSSLKILEIYSVRQVFLLAALTTAFTTLIPSLITHFSIGNFRLVSPEIYFSVMAIAFFIPLLITYPIALFLFNLIRLMNISIQKIDNHIKYDTLTGALTRGYFLKEVERAQINSNVFLMIDADHFKSVNDSYGHIVGDEVLREIVISIQNTIKDRGILGRLGGEEFGVYLPNMNVEDGLFIAWEICENMRNRSIKVGHKHIQMTLSIGLAFEASNKCFDITMREADECLYDAKRAGRDRVVAKDGMPIKMAMAS